jgi:predicted RNA-binding protein with PIN domain
MPTKYYIDGYNVLHKSSLLRGIARRDIEAAREQLIDKIVPFCIATGYQVYLVFDGRGAHLPQRAEHYRSVNNLEVIYAPGHLSADAVIERAIYQEKNRLDVVAVTNDRGVRDLCSGMGALTMEAGSFLQIVRESHGNIRSTLERTRKDGPSTSVIEDRLDGATRERLARLREQLKE